MSAAIFNVTRGTTIAAKIEKAETPVSRAKGLLGRESLGADEGLWIFPDAMLRFVPCPTIHTFFMKFSIDVLFLDERFTVLRVIENMRPWRLSPWVPSAFSVFELKGGSLQGSVRVGDRLELRPA